MIFGAIFGTIASIGSAICSAISTVGSFVATIAPIVVQAIGKVAGVIENVAKVLGAILPKESVEDFGNRAIQASEHGIKPDNFDNYNDYIQALRSFEVDPDFKFDPEKYPEPEKDIALAGVSVVGNMIANKFDLKMEDIGAISTAIAVDKSDYFTAERIAAMIKSKTLSVEKTMDFFEGNLSPSESKNTRESLVSMEKELGSTKSDLEIEYDLAVAQAEIQNEENYKTAIEG